MRRMRHLKPREIQGCQLALDASIATSLYDATSGGSLVADGAAVARWEDQSGNGNHVTQATSAARPLRAASGLNGLGILQLEETANANYGRWLDNSGFAPSLPISFIAVSHFNVISSVAVDSVSGSGNRIIAYRGGAGDSPGLNVFISGTKTATVSEITAQCVFAFSANVTDGIYGKINSTSFASSTGAGATTWNGIRLGSLRGIPAATLYGLDSFLAESAVWSSTLTVAVRERIAAAMHRKWRIKQ